MHLPSIVNRAVVHELGITKKTDAMWGLPLKNNCASVPFMLFACLILVHLLTTSIPAAAQGPIFRFAPSFLSGGLNAYSIAVADVNGDGKPDLLIANRCASSTNCSNGVVAVLLGNGDGTFQSAVSYASGGYEPLSIAVADVNEDGKPDLLLANLCINSSNCSHGTVGVLLGNGDGTFQSAVAYSSVGEYAVSLTVADVNGDGKPDVVVGNEYASGTQIANGTVAVLLGNGDGTFQSAVAYSSGGYAAQSVAMADVNGDGKPDVLVTNCASSSPCGNGIVSVLLGNGDGTFQSAAIYSSGGYDALWVAVGDVNGDGKLDLLVDNYCASSGNCANGTVAVLLGNGDGTFQPAVTYDSGGQYARFVAVADVNADGNPDLLVTNVYGTSAGTNGGISVLLGNGDGTFQSAKSYYSGGYEAYSAAVADVNADGKLDLVVANQCTSFNSCVDGAASVLLGNGDGTFVSAAAYYSGGYSSPSVAAADVNGDGKLDLVVANQCTSSSNCANGTVGVLLGNGDGTFQTAVAYSSGAESAYSVAVGDLNGDGKPDLVVSSECASSSNCTSGRISVLLGNGDGTFQTAVTYPSGGFEAFSVAIADVNGDGKVDLVVGNTCATSSSCTNGTIAVLLGNGDGTFQTAVAYGSGGNDVFSVAVADLNGDGKPDLVVSNYCASSGCTNGTIGVLLGNGDGTFQTAVAYDSGAYYASSVAVADVNADGKLDLVIANQCATSTCGSGAISVLLGNGDGTFQNPKTTVTPELQGIPQSLALADFNGDGKLDVASGAGNVLLLGNGDGTFQAPITLGSPGLGIAVGDFNGDGKPDLAVGNVIVLLNITENFQDATTTMLVSSGNPATGSVTFTATVTPAFNAGQLTGTITFYNGTAALGSASLSNGQAVLSNVNFTPGSYSITAVYGGNTTYLSSTSSVLNETVNSANTITSISSLQNPSVYSQSVSLTASVTASAGGTPSGNVTFLDGSNILASLPLTNGSAVLVSSVLAIGTHSITASYAGAGDDDASTSSPLLQVVNQQPTSLALNSSPNPSTINQSVALAATITTQYGGTPTGTVTFSNGTTTLGSSAVNVSGVATLTITTLPVGNDSITAVYSGDSNFSGSTSPPLSQMVQKASTTTTNSSSVNPSTEGQTVIFTAKISSATSGSPTGSVSFLDGVAQIGSATLAANGTATFSISTLSVGTHSITAEYQGDANFNGSSSSAVSQVVQPGSTGVSLVSSQNPSSFDKAVTLTATVSSSAPGSPTGTVAFANGTTVLGSSPLAANGSASLTIATLTVGTNTIIAVYSGDTTFGSSTSSILSQSVQKANTTSAVVSSANPAGDGQSVTFTATISPGTLGTPTGTVSFFNGITQIGSTALSASGTAIFSSSSLSVGTNAITAVYSGDGNFNSSTSPVLNQVVQRGNTGIGLTSSPNPSSFYYPVVLTARVSSSAPGTPTGTVSFWRETTNLGTSALNTSGVATLALASLPVGTDGITASYSGDSNFVAATSSVMSQTVHKANTTTKLVSSSSADILALTATVSGENSGTPTGTVTFMNGTIELGSATLNGTGVATLSVTALSDGHHGITSTYGGNGNFSSSTSNTLTIESDFRVSVSALSPSALAPGESAVATVTVTSSNGFNPTGANLSCSITPIVSPSPTCSIGSMSANSGTGNAKLTVATAGSSTALASPSQRPSRGWLAFSLFIPAMLLGTARSGKGQQRRLALFAVICLLGGACIFQSACGAGNTGISKNGSAGTPAGTYTITITGSANGTQRSTSARFVVQ